ncbi:MAG: hypothetical protein ACTH0S_10550 [Senegalia sp. (in: firmicutes)]
MKKKWNVNLFFLTIVVVILLFSFNTKSYAKYSGDGGNRIATFVVPSDYGLHTRFAEHSYSFFEVYSTGSNNVYALEHGMLSYYSNWTGWALADLYNSTINKINFYNSNNSYVDTTGTLNKPYEVILPGDSEGISARKGYNLVKISDNKAIAKTTFSLLCREAVNPVSSKRLSMDLD